MRTLKLPLAVIVTALAMAVSAQSPRPKIKTPAAEIKKPNPGSSAFTAAVAQNVTLRNELAWTFGGKQQRGWYLYDLLIGKTLNTIDGPGTTNFAAFIEKWQKRRGITADGVLDEDALMAMVSQWQNDRLKIRTYATPDQLLTAPPSDLYDPSRADELRQVERTTYAAYKEMMAAALADPML